MQITDKDILPEDIERFFIEINLRKVKWLLFANITPITR